MKMRKNIFSELEGRQLGGKCLWKHFQPGVGHLSGGKLIWGMCCLASAAFPHNGFAQQPSLHNPGPCYWRNMDQACLYMWAFSALWHLGLGNIYCCGAFGDGVFRDPGPLGSGTFCEGTFRNRSFHDGTFRDGTFCICIHFSAEATLPPFEMSL